MNFDDPSLANTPYIQGDVDQIEAQRGKPYTRLRATVNLLDITLAQKAELETEVAMLKLTRTKLSQLVDYYDLEKQDYEDKLNALRAEVKRLGGNEDL